jgi:hypothetical protein
MEPKTLTWKVEYIAEVVQWTMWDD